MKPEALQFLSIVVLFIGLLLTGLGGLGTLHFGRQRERAEDNQRAAAVHTLTEIVSTLQEEQRGLLDRLANAEKHVNPPTLAASTPPPASELSASSPEPQTEPAAVRAPEPTPADSPAPALPPVAAGSASAPESAPDSDKSKVPQVAMASTPALARLTFDDDLVRGEKRAALVKELRRVASLRVSLRAAAGNPRAVKVAIALRSIFREAQWGVGDIEMTSDNLPGNTLAFFVGAFPPPNGIAGAYRVLESSGFAVTTGLDPSLGSERVTIAIGPLPEPR